MALKLKASSYIFLTLLIPQMVNAGVYLSLAPTSIAIKASAGKTKPLMTDVRIGYALDNHKLELAAMSPSRDDNLNQLVTEIPGVTSLLYRYADNFKESFRVDLILGYSEIDIQSTYTSIPTFSESFQGVSFGIGFEEELKSIRQLKLKFDYVQLYRGDKLKINALSIGIRYEF